MTLHTPILTSALDDAQSTWEAACDLADMAFYRWLREQTPESRVAWNRASEGQSKACAELLGLELEVYAQSGVVA